MCLMVATRPDLAAAVGVLIQFVADPFPAHCQAFKRVYCGTSNRYQLTESNSYCKTAIVCVATRMQTMPGTSNQEEVRVSMRS